MSDATKGTERLRRIPRERLAIARLFLHLGMVPVGLYAAYTAVKIILAYEPNPGISDDSSNIAYLFIFLGGLRGCRD